MTKKVLVAMSGGVDSAVSALLLKNAGYDCIGCTMNLYDRPEEEKIDRACCSLSDVEDARSVAAKIGIPYYVWNLKEEFKREVIDRFIADYLAGRTPNPCIDCNRYMKFGELYQRAKTLGCDYVATGHYARIEQSEDGLYHLKKGLDPKKDQSYVLYRMTQEQLAHTLFPLGKMEKEETRALAEKNGFLNAAKRDSQDICFVPDGDYAKVLEQYVEKVPPPGEFLDEDGNLLGRHKGIIHYTIGQHKGLGLPTDEPLYVKRICPEDNTVILCKSDSLFSCEATARDMNWISGSAPENAFSCLVKIRYRHKEEPAIVTPLEDGRIKILFATPQRAITPGQSAVFYDGDVVLGGGFIK